MPHRKTSMTVPDDGDLASAARLFADPRLRQYSDLAGLLMYRADLATGAIEWTPALLWQLGYRPEDVTPTVDWWLGSMHPEDMATVTVFLREALEGKRAEWELHYRLRRADGSWAHVEGRARLLRDAAGRPVSTEGVVRDVSEQRAAEEALREREAAFRLLAEGSRELICRHAQDGTYTYVSSAIREITGWEPTDLVGRNPYEFFHPDDHTRIQEEGHATAMRGELNRNGVVYRFRCEDGSHVWLDTLTRPIVNDAGDIVEFQTSSRDVTERRLLEERLARSQKLEAIGVLAAGVAHDFNNLMTIVRGNIELLQDQPTHPEASELLAEVHDATQRAAALTRQLLIIGRREMTRLTPMDIAATVRTLAGLLARLTGDRAEVVLAADHPCWVEADASMIEQVLLNLVKNARDATDGPGRIHVSVAAVTVAADCVSAAGHVPAGDWIRLSVLDDGIGMSAEVLARAFEPFFTTKSEDLGTGLGLATVQAVVQRLGGHLTIDSAPMQGATVSCFFAPTAAFDTDFAAAAPLAGRADEAKGNHILVVDDEPSVLAVARRMLERNGYSVTTAVGGLDAMAKFELGLSPDLLLTDVMMPGMSGRALAESVLVRAPAMPVVFMSGFAREGLLQDGMIGQDHPLVRKPFALDELLGVVQEALAREPQH